MALVAMRKQKSGHIINIGSVGADRFTLRENSVPYFLAKNGVYILTKAMAWEEAGSGIHINMISPASMKTDIFSKNDFPMGRETKYEDVCGAVKFLLSKGAYYINGVNLEVAGAFVPGMR
jgi:3-oxoacyl-[acyl-carrier protein] reductase